MPAQQGPKRNPQGNMPTVAPAAYTSRKAGEYDDSLDSLTRYAGRIKLKDDSKSTYFNKLMIGAKFPTGQIEQRPNKSLIPAHA